MSLPLHSLDVAELFRRLAAGAALEDVLREQPGLSLEDLRTCFAYAAEVLGNAAPLAAKNETVEWTAVKATEPATLPAPSAVDEAATLAPTVEVTPSTPTKRISLPGYEILGKLGEGGMGVVYKARHQRLNRIVAIKMILAGEHASKQMIERFAVEAEAVAQLQHPGIVQIREIGEHDGHSFLALEYVAGGSLAARLDDKPWPADQAAELVETLARSMQVAHDHGIVHRDLKPENVLLAEPADAADEQLTPKITDFGLAKRLQETAGRTRTGEIMGTPSYMAPEQAAGKKDIGPAADVYALGAILYRLLAGKPPFQADTSLDTMMLVLEQEPVPLRTLNKKLPRDLETIALKCLAKEPAKRYASAAELTDDLRRFLDGEPIKARRRSSYQRLDLWCRKRPGAALSRAIFVLLLLASILDRSPDSMGKNLVGIIIWLFFIGAVARTRLRPFLIGLSFSVVLPLVSVLCFHILGPRLPTPLAESGSASSSFIPGLDAVDVAFLAYLLPLLLGLIKGVFSRLRGQLFGLCFVLMFLIATLRHSEPVRDMFVASLICLYYGILCRFMCWYDNGNLIDSLVGSVLGTVVGAFFGGGVAVIIVSIVAFLIDAGSLSDRNVVITATLAGVIAGSPIGSFLGAHQGAISGRKASRRE